MCTKCSVSTCLVLFEPGEFIVIHVCKFLGALYHKVNEVTTASQAAQDQNIGKDPEEATQVDVFILLVFLFIDNGFLQVALKQHYDRF